MQISYTSRVWSIQCSSILATKPVGCSGVTLRQDMYINVVNHRLTGQISCLVKFWNCPLHLLQKIWYCLQIEEVFVHPRNWTLQLCSKIKHAVASSASFQVEIYVTSPEKLFIFIIYKCILWINVSKKYLIKFRTQKHWLQETVKTLPKRETLAITSDVLKVCKTITIFFQKSDEKQTFCLKSLHILQTRCSRKNNEVD